MALSQTPTLPSPVDREHGSRQAPPLLAFVLAAFFGVIIFLPPAGRIGVPLHDSFILLLGRAAFLVPLGLVCTGVVLVIRALRPSTPLPHRRLAGVGLIALGILPGEYLIGGRETTGMIGGWLGTWLLDLAGGPTTLVLLAATLGVGALLAFDVKLLRAAATAGRWNDAES